MSRAALALLVALIAATTARAGAVAARPQLAIPHVAKGPVIDGTLADDAWKSAKQLALSWDL